MMMCASDILHSKNERYSHHVKIHLVIIRIAFQVIPAEYPQPKGFFKRRGWILPLGTAVPIWLLPRGWLRRGLS